MRLDPPPPLLDPPAHTIYNLVGTANPEILHLAHTGHFFLTHVLVWPLELGIRTPTLWCGPLSWGYGLPHFGVAP